MTWLERPDVNIKNVEGKELAKEMRDLAKRLGVDLNQANDIETKTILRGLKSSLSDEIVRTRENSD